MSWNLIKSIQQDTDVRLILPFGLSLQPGDVISVGKDGSFRLEGSTRSLLGLEPGDTRPAPGGVDLYRLSGVGTSCTFRAAGEASALFPEMPTAGARFDISFGSARGWMLAATGRQLRSLDELNRFRLPILSAYTRHVWKPDWALVTSVASASKMTLLASTSRDTKVVLSVSATTATATAIEARLTSNASISATNQQVTQCITNAAMPVGCSGLRVRDPWWRSPDISNLEAFAPQRDVEAATDEEFWEDVNEL